MSLLLLAHAAATLIMAGALWFVQLVHYPLLAAVPPAELPTRAAENIRGTSFVLGPVMALELGCALRLAWSPPEALAPGVPWCGLALLAAAWLSTALIQFPIHLRLSRGGDPAEMGRLMRGNWLRVSLWSIRALLALGMLAAAP